MLSSVADYRPVGDRVPRDAGPQRHVTMSRVGRSTAVNQLEQGRRSTLRARLQISSTALRLAGHRRRPVIYAAC